MAREGRLQSSAIGEVAEWSIAAVLKTVDPRGSVGSNPTLSAISLSPAFSLSSASFRCAVLRAPPGNNRDEALRRENMPLAVPQP